MCNGGVCVLMAVLRCNGGVCVLMAVLRCNCGSVRVDGFVEV